MAAAPFSNEWFWDNGVKAAFVVVSAACAVVTALVGGDYGRVKERIENLQNEQSKIVTNIAEAKVEIKTELGWVKKNQDSLEQKIDRILDRQWSQPASAAASRRSGGE